MVCGAIAAAPRPWTARAAISQPMEGASAANELDYGTLDRKFRRELLDRTLIWNQRHLI